tara:strand:- start:192 stop:2672 length:2481 start_codon:yes stop_codon:yes gene_type:complete
MAIARVSQTNFNRGEIDPKLIGRVNLLTYGNSLKKARNVIVNNQGSVERRPGTYFRADLGASSRLESFIFSGDQEYIFAFQNTALKIYSTAGVLLQTLTSQPWNTAALFELNYTQQGDTMIVVHKDFMPRIITRTGATTFTSAALTFDSSLNSEKVYQPYFKFADDTITLDIDSVTKDATGVTCTTSSAYFTSDHVGTRIRYMGAELLITGYTSSTVVTATLKAVPLIELDEDPFATTAGSGVVTVTHVAHGFSTGASVVIAGTESINDADGNGIAYTTMNGTFSVTVVDDDHWQFTAGSSDTATESVDGGGVRVTISGHPPTRNWDEQVFSAVNGYPKAVCFHEQRLFFAGVENLPDAIHSSKTASFYNFDVGKSEDADSVQIQIASDEINDIRHIRSGKVLEILTNTSEFYLKPQVGKPITPADIKIIRQSSNGTQQKAMPRFFDGATLYIQGNGRTIREYLYNSALEEFASAPISIEANHLISSPTDSASVTALPNRTEQLYFLVNDDGTVAVYSSQRAEKILGWVQWNTSGTFESVCATSDTIYFAVQRTINSATVYYLEQLSSTVFDIPTDMTVTKTLSASYQPHGSPLTNGTTSSSTGFIADGFTNAPSVGEKFQFAGSGTEYTITAASATSTSGEYSITINAAVSTTNNVELRFTYSKTWSGLNSAPDMRGLTVYGTSGSTEGGNINYYGDGTVTSGGVVVLDSIASAIDIGTNYTLEINTLPIDAVIERSGGKAPLTGHPRKIAKAIVEISNSYNLKVNTNDVIITTVSDLNNSDTLASFTGKKEVYFLGYDLEPSMEITQSVPLPLRVLAITSEIYY